MKMLALGIMSGTSLDGIDLALCSFLYEEGKWNYKILDAETVAYSAEWKSRLRNASTLNVQDFLLLHNEYGRFIGELINDFLQGKPTPEVICSHGHTIFHQPERQFTFQLGNGAFIAATTGITTISDFRTMDVALGGQGAPLVPVGDKLLFQQYDYCINLGGFANISFDYQNQRIAFDICPVNIVLNALAEKRNLPFDKDGELGKMGKINKQLLDSLNSLEYYSRSWPKSLGREWVEQTIFPLLDDSALSIEDQIATFYEHVSNQIENTVTGSGKVLFTGGGSLNGFLIHKLQERMNSEIIIPEETTINFKEALIFAFLGVLTFTGGINCFASVTGAGSDSIVGSIFQGLK